VELSVSSNLLLVLASVAFWQQDTLGVQGVNAYFEQDLQFSRKGPEFGGRKQISNMQTTF
jgi:hypothetical protein